MIATMKLSAAFLFTSIRLYLIIDYVSLIENLQENENQNRNIFFFAIMISKISSQLALIL